MYYYLTPKSIAFNSSFSDLKAKVNFFLALTLLKEKVINIARKKGEERKNWPGYCCRQNTHTHMGTDI